MKKIITIPKLSSELEFVSVNVLSEKQYVKYFPEGVQAGFPSPADDFKDKSLSLDEKYLNNPDATFLIKVKGDSMFPTLFKNDLLIVKSDKKITNNKIGIFSVNNTEFTVKRFNKGVNMLIADNENFENISITDDDTVLCLGVVENLIRDL